MSLITLENVGTEKELILINQDIQTHVNANSIFIHPEYIGPMKLWPLTIKQDF